MLKKKRANAVDVAVFLSFNPELLCPNVDKLSRAYENDVFLNARMTYQSFVENDSAAAVGLTFLRSGEEVFLYCRR